jgi:hypothetical protein
MSPFGVSEESTDKGNKTILELFTDPEYFRIDHLGRLSINLGSLVKKLDLDSDLETLNEKAYKKIQSVVDNLSNLAMLSAEIQVKLNILSKEFEEVKSQVNFLMELPE